MRAVQDWLAGEVFRRVAVFVQSVPQGQAASADVAEVVEERGAVGGRRGGGGESEGVNCSFKLADVPAVNAGACRSVECQPLLELAKVEPAFGGEVEQVRASRKDVWEAVWFGRVGYKVEPGRETWSSRM